MTKNPAKSSASRKTTGAGPSLAAHSKDAKTDAKSGQSKKATAKKS